MIKERIYFSAKLADGFEISDYLCVLDLNSSVVDGAGANIALQPANQPRTTAVDFVVVATAAAVVDAAEVGARRQSPVPV